MRTLSEIATLMNQNGSLELIVVGHTDNNGTLDYNLDLSLRRSQAVVAALISEFAVARNRLPGCGSYITHPSGGGFRSARRPARCCLAKTSGRP
jgi:OmpA-OmpF porin, OOP family